MRRASLLLGCLIACAPVRGRVRAPAACTPGPSSGPLELVVLGSGGPGSFGRAASGYLVLVDGVARVLVDVGPGVFLRLGELDVDLARLDTILLTHLHVDHAGDLPGFVKARDVAHHEPLVFHVFGPAGGGPYPATTTFVERLFGADGAFGYLPAFRNPLRFDAVDLPVARATAPHRVVEADDLVVTSIAVDHGEVPAVAYRIEHAGRALVISGDLAAGDDNLARLAAGAQLLVHDAAVLDPPGSPASLYRLHAAPRRIGEVAAAAGVASLMLGHVSPAVERAAPEVLRSVRAGYAGPVRVAGDCLRVPIGE